jgi:hypothetical protein
MARRDIRPDPPALQPPNLSALDGLHFTPQDREARGVAATHLG